MTLVQFFWEFSGGVFLFFWLWVVVLLLLWGRWWVYSFVLLWNTGWWCCFFVDLLIFVWVVVWVVWLGVGLYGSGSSELMFMGLRTCSCGLVQIWNACTVLGLLAYCWMKDHLTKKKISVTSLTKKNLKSVSRLWKMLLGSTWVPHEDLRENLTVHI